MNDNTILRIKVPAHLYEAVKAQLTLDEGKQNFGTKDMKPVKGQKATGGSSDKPKKTSAPKAKAPKKAEAPAAEKKEVPKDGHKKAEKKPRSIEELKAAYEALGQMISEMEDEGKEPVEEGKEEIEETKDTEEGKEEMEEGWSSYKTGSQRRREAGHGSDEPGEAAYDRERSYRKYGHFKDLDRYGPSKVTQKAQKQADKSASTPGYVNE